MTDPRYLARRQTLEELARLIELASTLRLHEPGSDDRETALVSLASIREFLGDTTETEHTRRLEEQLDHLEAALSTRWQREAYCVLHPNLLAVFKDLQRHWANADERLHKLGPRHKTSSNARIAFHVFAGTSWSAVYLLFFDKSTMMVALSINILLFMVDDMLRIWRPSSRPGIVAKVFQRLSRPEESAGIASSTWYLWGILLSVVMTPKSAVICGTLTLAISDPLAGVVGRRWGRAKLYRNKSWAGTIAFALSGSVINFVCLAALHSPSHLSSYVWISAAAATAAAAAETLGDHINDNFSIVVVSSLVLDVLLRSV